MIIVISHESEEARLSSLADVLAFCKENKLARFVLNAPAIEQTLHAAGIKDPVVIAGIFGHGCREAVADGKVSIVVKRFETEAECCIFHAATQLQTIWLQPSSDAIRRFISRSSLRSVMDLGPTADHALLFEQSNYVPNNIAEMLKSTDYSIISWRQKLLSR